MMNTITMDSSCSRIWFVKNTDTGEMTIPSPCTRETARTLQRMIRSTGVSTRIGSFSAPEINYKA